MSDFILHPRLSADTSFVTDWPLCRVLLMEEARYFWLILVPRIVAPASADARGEDWSVREITDLSAEDRARLMEEAARAGRAITAAPGVAKLNIGALGNIVPQLHLHVIGRAPGDPAWPGPVWGHSPAVPCDAALREARAALVRSH